MARTALRPEPKRDSLAELSHLAVRHMARVQIGRATKVWPRELRYFFLTLIRRDQPSLSVGEMKLDRFATELR